MVKEMSEEEFWKKHDETKAKMTSRAMEALQDLYHRIPFGEKIMFSDGREGVITKFVEPTISTDRDDHLANIPRASIDIQFEDGHLEFMLYQSGWGGNVIPDGTH